MARMARSGKALVLSIGTLVALTSALQPSTLEAQPSPTTTDPKDMARRLGEEALALHGQGRFKEAFERFETAEKIAHSPVLVLWMARSKRALGELREAKRLYQKVASEELAEDASPKWLSAKTDATAELAVVSRRIPHLRVVVLGGPPDASVEVDGNVVLANVETELDPGKHEVIAKALHAAPVSRAIELEEGQPVRSLELRFSTGPRAERSTGSFVPGGIVFGFGLATLVGGAATGGAALSLAGQIKEGCVGNQCLRADQGKEEDAKRLATASTACLVVGGVVTAVGTGLLIAHSRLGKSDNVSLDVGPLRAGLTLAF